MLGRGGEEQRAQFLRHGEGDHEVGDAEAFAQLALHPAGRGVPAALRAGAVVATVVGEADRPAGGAAMDVSTQGWRAAMGQRPNGAATRAIRHGVFTPKPRQETAQRPDDGGGHGGGFAFTVASRG